MKPALSRNLSQVIRFLAVGAAAFVVDAGLLLILHACGLSPLAGRIISIACAMAVAWLLNRRFTFRVATPPNLREFLAYATLGWGVAALNYGLFAFLLATRLVANPLLATAIATLAATVVSFTGMRLGVFRHR